MKMQLHRCARTQKMSKTLNVSMQVRVSVGQRGMQGSSMHGTVFCAVVYMWNRWPFINCLHTYSLYAYSVCVCVCMWVQVGNLFTCITNWQINTTKSTCYKAKKHCASPVICLWICTHTHIYPKKLYIAALYQVVDILTQRCSKNIVILTIN